MTLRVSTWQIMSISHLPDMGRKKMSLLRSFGRFSFAGATKMSSLRDYRNTVPLGSRNGASSGRKWSTVW